MKKLNDEDAEKYKRIFSRYVKSGIKPDSLESTWKKVHAAIRADPSYTKQPLKPKPSNLKKRKHSLNLAQRKDKVKQRMAYHRRLAQQNE